MTALAALLVVSYGYWFAAIFAAYRYRSSISVQKADTNARPAISILKPAHGAQENFSGNLRSHAAQSYPNFEILVGVRESDEAAIQTVEQVQREFPGVHIEAIVCREAVLGLNPKIAVLRQLAERAKHPVWVISDADIEAPPSYLEALAAALEQPNVGLVTCLFHAQPGRGLPSLLEALWINGEFMGQILLARAVQGMKFAMGATIAFRRDVFEKVGGFSALLPYIGDDYVLGENFHRAGRQVSLCSVPAGTHLPDYTIAEVWRHQLRWSRTIRSQRPAGHFGLIVTFGSVWAVASMVLVPQLLWAPALGAIAVRCQAGACAALASGTRLSLKQILLLPLVDICAFLVWLASFLSNEVTWAGKKYRLGPKGKILP